LTSNKLSSTSRVRWLRRFFSPSNTSPSGIKTTKTCNYTS
jgi:hypothetical protein